MVFFFFFHSHYAIFFFVFPFDWPSYFWVGILRVYQTSVFFFSFSPELLVRHTPLNNTAIAISLSAPQNLMERLLLKKPHVLDSSIRKKYRWYWSGSFLAGFPRLQSGQGKDIGNFWWEAFLRAKYRYTSFLPSLSYFTF